MLNGRSARDRGKSRIALFSADCDLVETTRSLLEANASIGLSLAASGRDDQAAEREIRDAAVVIVDIGAPEEREQSLSALKRLLGRIDSDVPVIAVVNSFDEVVARLLVRMRVADILVKPVAPLELVQACERLVRTGGEDS